MLNNKAALMLLLLFFVGTTKALVHLELIDPNQKQPDVPERRVECPMVKCRADCKTGYVRDENGCQTCRCIPEEKALEEKGVTCSPVMCRMFCQNGFRRDANGCEICSCTPDPPPCPLLNCARECTNGFRTDARGCATCECACRQPVCPVSPNSNCTSRIENDFEGCPVCTCSDGETDLDKKCPPLKCMDVCKYGRQRDVFNCPLCTCNRCPQQMCRKFCPFGFQRNLDGCEICDCEPLPPTVEDIMCSEREPCPDNHVCNLNMQKCETVPSDKINYFTYNFNIKTSLVRDQSFVQVFKNGLIQNIAAKYALKPPQIAVSAVEKDLTVSFHVMAYYAENMDEFNRKMEQMEIDLNTNRAFDSVLPSVVKKFAQPSWFDKLCASWNKQRLILVLAAILLSLVTLIFVTCFIMLFRRRVLGPRSESKLPIFGYEQAPSDEEQYHAVHAPDGTAYVVVESEDMEKASDKRALV